MTGRAPVARPRRFYETVRVAPADTGHGVLLDARPLKTPAGAPVVLPTLAAADLVALEWTGQGEILHLENMPTTRLVNVAIDRMAGAREDTAAKICAYVETDLLLYRAPDPAELVARQAQGWDPLIEWAGAQGIVLTPTTGLLARSQPAPSLAAAAARALACDDFALCGLAHAAALLGSGVLALAVQAGRLDGETAFALSRIDEDFQSERWGADAEASARAANLLFEVKAVSVFLAALR